MQMTQKHLLCFYTSNMVKSDEDAINHVNANFPPSLILHWKYMLSKQSVFDLLNTATA